MSSSSADDGSDWESDLDEFDRDMSGWKELERDNSTVQRALSRVLRALPGAAQVVGARKTKLSPRCVFRAVRDAHNAVPADFVPTRAQVDALIGMSTALERKSLHSGKHGNGDFLNNAITAAQVAAAAIPGDRPELAQRLDSLSRMIAVKSRRKDLEDWDHAIEAARRATELTPTGDGQRITRLRAVSKLFEERFEYGGRNKADLEQAILSYEMIVEGNPELGRDVVTMVANNIAYLRFKGGDRAAISNVLEVPFTDIGNGPLSLAGASPYRFRFLDCNEFVQEIALRLVEFEFLPEDRYAAVSYVWKGLRPGEGSGLSQRFMTVRGAEDADPISLAVLRTACMASLKLGSDLLWLDRLCILQENDLDKSWQIKNMHQIYQSCRACLVFPGGLARLGDLAEETSWIHRAWTLQEAVAPPDVHCVFSWTLGATAHLQSHFSVTVREIEPRASGMTNLYLLLRGTLSSPMTIWRSGPSTPGPKEHCSEQQINVLADGGGRGSHIQALLGALNKDEKELQADAIWRSALMRTSSRPVDMVFSIMGLLGVSLEPTAFARHDRRAATVALMRGLLACGEPARWLATSLSLTPDPHISTLPIMPETSVEGRAYVLAPKGRKEVAELVGHSWWWLKGAPNGEMDERGHLKFKARAATVISKKKGGSSLLSGKGKKYRHQQNNSIQSESGEEWIVIRSRDDILSESAYMLSFAVVIGKYEDYTDATIAYIASQNNVVVMFVGENAVGKWHNVGYGRVSLAMIKGWEIKEFEVGGLNPI
ncbi:hypothetical protein B0T25DRAFT_544359 [Lasiosphaeria hispida]|uniref:Heterokaryon incompatibility domain-containing protein n=1 Tax=Lasiosphaeria hispida TaxID=260671 RepID=A0AAJ0MEN8_9PEZI|nr:hypothetical protein B0T25DRAFT_544359 [Lasiosphaeria hispida]